MGGDHAPSAVVDGAVAAARHPAARIALVGPAAKVEHALALHPDWPRLGLEIVEAPDVIEMSDAPAAALRCKPRASIRVAADLVAHRTAGALFSAGHTGAPLIGVSGLVIVGHGRSSAKAVRNAIAMAYRFATSDFLRCVEQDCCRIGAAQASMRPPCLCVSVARRGEG